jgi:hypothetical protein
MGNCIRSSLEFSQSLQTKTQKKLVEIQALQEDTLSRHTRQCQGIDDRIREIQIEANGSPTVSQTTQMRLLLQRRSNCRTAMASLQRQLTGTESQQQMVSNLHHTSQVLYINRELNRDLKRLGLSPEKIEKELEVGQTLRDDMADIGEMVSSFTPGDNNESEIEDEMNNIFADPMLSSFPTVNDTVFPNDGSSSVSSREPLISDQSTMLDMLLAEEFESEVDEPVSRDQVQTELKYGS